MFRIVFNSKFKEGQAINEKQGSFGSQFLNERSSSGNKNSSLFGFHTFVSENNWR